MRRRNLLIGVAPLAMSVLLAACDKAPEAQLQPNPKSWNLPIMTAPMGAPIEHTTVGSVVSDQRVDIASRLSGYIREIQVQEGDRVQRGQVLARLDAADVEGGIRQAAAAHGAAQAALRDAQTDLDRFERLFERGGVSDNEMRKVRLKFDAAREALNQARAGLDTALAQRAYAEISSPVDGLVVARLKRVGDLAVPGVPLLTVESGRDLLFETFVAESRIAAIETGQAARVSLDSLPAPLSGRVTRVVPSGDPVSRRYQVKIALPETPGLMPGMFGRAVFTLGESPAPVVPRRALTERGGLTGVFVVDGEGLARFRWLRTGREWPDRVEVSAGLAADERFVAAVEPALREGDRVIPAEAAQ
ncbi:MAG: efflux RND transporter periplasmic adaptor subunit [Halothiobacillaceae bacterium]|jgi:RND family efflux transporter, MFP subunit|nr:efflux RND transporter periplasmic adaptor subunit [Halothiobacillaceae bacterium]